MGKCSGIYSWQGGGEKAPARPECSKATHAKIVNATGMMLFDARKKAYAYYCKECKAWGRDPMDEQLWFQNAKAVYARLMRGEDVRGSGNVGRQKSRKELKPVTDGDWFKRARHIADSMLNGGVL